MHKALASLVSGLAALALANVAQARSELAYTAGKGSPRVWLADANGRHARRLGPGSTTLLSPDGSSVAAALFASKGAAVVIYRPGSATQSYFNLQKVSAVPLVWSPDSRYLAVQLTGVGVMGRGSGLAIIDTTSSKVRKLATGSVCGASFAPSHRNRIVYGRSPGAFSCFSGKVNVYASKVSGAGRQQLTHDGASGNPVWGAAGIAFDRATQRKGEAPSYQVWLMRSNGTDQRQITHTTVPPLLDGLVPLAFSANGKRLLADYEGEDTVQTWTIEFPSDRSRQLTVKGQSVVPYGISTNGRRLLVGYGSFENPPSKGTVDMIPFGGGRATVLVKHGAGASWNR